MKTVFNLVTFSIIGFGIGLYVGQSSKGKKLIEDGKSKISEFKKKITTKTDEKKE